MRGANRTQMHRKQGGAWAVEFGLIGLMFFGLTFGILELSRAMYLLNTLTEAVNRTARGAAVTDPGNAVAMGAMRRRAAFADGNGKVPLAGAIDVDHFKIDYLQRDASTLVSPMPSCAAANAVNCVNDPNGPACIRYVRVKLTQCTAAGVCSRVPYTPMISVMPYSAYPVTLPTFETVVPVQSLGLSTAATCP